MKCKRKLGPTDIKYKIICAGSAFDILVGKQIVVICNNKQYNAKIHN